MATPRFDFVTRVLSDFWSSPPGRVLRGSPTGVAALSAAFTSGAPSTRDAATRLWSTFMCALSKKGPKGLGGAIATCGGCRRGGGRKGALRVSARAGRWRRFLARPERLDRHLVPLLHGFEALAPRPHLTAHVGAVPEFLRPDPAPLARGARAVGACAPPAPPNT